MYMQQGQMVNLPSYKLYVQYIHAAQWIRLSTTDWDRQSHESQHVLHQSIYILKSNLIDVYAAQTIEEATEGPARQRFPKPARAATDGGVRFHLQIRYKGTRWSPRRNRWAEITPQRWHFLRRIL